VELRLVADVGFLGMPNAGKSTLLSSASAAKPKIANYPFTTIVPNLGVCDLGEESSGLVLCDIPGLIEGAAQGTGLGFSFLRHVQRCKVLLHVVDGTSDDPVGDFNILNKELAMYDDMLGKKPQVVVLNKCDVSEVKEKQDELVDKLRLAAGHSRVMTISAATTENVQELMGRLKKFVEAEKKKAIEEDSLEDDVVVAEVDFSKAALDSDSDDFEIMSDPAYPGQWRVTGDYIEQIAKMTHWEYPEAVERFGRQLKALGIADELSARGAFDGDLVMIGEYDFDFNPGLTNPYIPQELLERDALFEEKENKDQTRAMLLNTDDDDDEEEEEVWRPFSQGGYMDMDKDEIVEFNDDGGWDLLEDDFDLSPEFLEGDEVWTS
jgi:GTP-binding protein